MPQYTIQVDGYGHEIMGFLFDSTDELDTFIEENKELEPFDDADYYGEMCSADSLTHIVNVEDARVTILNEKDEVIAQFSLDKLKCANDNDSLIDDFCNNDVAFFINYTKCSYRFIFNLDGPFDENALQFTSIMFLEALDDVSFIEMDSHFLGKFLYKNKPISEFDGYDFEVAGEKELNYFEGLYPMWKAHAKIDLD